MSLNMVALLSMIYFMVYTANAICQIDNSSLENALTSLKNKGYIIERGHLEWKFNRSSYGANPSFVYGIYNFERIEFNNMPAHHDMHYNMNINISIRQHQSINNFWFMYGSSALLFYGCLPPATHYFSYKSYVNRRYNPANTTNFSTKYIPEEDPYGSLGDMLNHEIINKTYSAPNNRNLSIIISTGDEVSFNEVSSSLIAANNDFNDMINLDGIPMEWIQYKNKDWFRQLLDGGTVDSVGCMLRSYNKPIYNVSEKEFKEYFIQNQTVFKLYHSNHTNAMPRKPLSVENTTQIVRYNESEQINITPNERAVITSYFDEYIQYLVDFMSKEKDNRYMYRSLTVSVPFYKGKMDYGYSCIEHGTRCLADNRDCQYFMSWPNVSYLPKNKDIVQFIVGVVHPDMGTCQWGSIVPYFPQDGIVEHETHTNYRANEMVLMDFEYKYSALTFPPNVNRDKQTIPTNVLDKFFIISVMRPETVKSYQYFNMTPSLVIHTDKLRYKDGYSPFHRCYINNITTTRPPAQNMIPFVVVEFLKY